MSASKGQRSAVALTVTGSNGSKGTVRCVQKLSLVWQRCWLFKAQPFARLAASALGRAKHCAAVAAQERFVLHLSAPEGRASPRIASTAPTAQAAAPGYARHVSERTLLYARVQAHYPDFIARLAAEDRSLLGYAREEFRAFLRCGMLDYGFLRVVYEQCHANKFVWSEFEQPQAGPKGVGQEARSNGCWRSPARRVVLPQQRRAAHGRECALLGGRGVRPAAGAAVAAEFSVSVASRQRSRCSLRLRFAAARLVRSVALPVRQQARSHRLCVGDRASRDRRMVGGSSGRRARQRAVRGSDVDPSLRQRAQPQYSISHA